MQHGDVFLNENRIAPLAHATIENGAGRGCALSNTRALRWWCKPVFCVYDVKRV